jgi:hypothetical protein
MDRYDAILEQLKKAHKVSIQWLPVSTPSSKISAS